MLYMQTHTYIGLIATCQLDFAVILYFKMPSICPSVSATVSASINPLPSDRLRCCDPYIRCQRSLAVKPLTMSGSPSHRGSVRRVSRSQVTHVPISNCSCWCARWQLANWCRLAETTAARRAAKGRARRLGLSQRPARVDCGLAYTTGQATIARSAIVACVRNKE